MTTTTSITRPTLVARWVPVTDISGRVRLERRWVVSADANSASAMMKPAA
ncbi:MAG: hypothetical protein ACRDVZ_17855 [Jiangellaceae bacterium]